MRERPFDVLWTRFPKYYRSRPDVVLVFHEDFIANEKSTADDDADVPTADAILAATAG